MDKKIGLEHTIRNIIQESIGGPNTDKFKGTPKAFLQPAPHIEPKVGDSHPDGSSVTAKRGLAKIRTSETMKEAHVDESVVKGPAKWLKNEIENSQGTVKTLEKEKSKFELAPLEPETSKKQLVPVEPNKKEPATAEPVATNKGKVVATSQSKGDLEAKRIESQKVEPKVDAKTKMPSIAEPKVQTQLKTDIETSVQPKVQTQTQTQTQTQVKTEPKVEPKVQTQTQTQTKLNIPPPNKPPSESEENPPRRRRFGGLSFPGVRPEVISGLQGYVPFKPYMHYAQNYVSFGESATDDRRSIENVARPGGKTRVAKQAELKQKIIDENTKRVETIKRVISDKKNSTVNLNPKLKHQELDEAGGVTRPVKPDDSLSKFASSAYNYVGSKINQGLDYVNPLMQGKRDPKTGEVDVPSEYQYRGKDMAADAMGLAPVAGIPATLYSMKRDLNRGDYQGLGLDTLGLIPGAKYVTGPAKVAKIAKIEKAANIIGAAPLAKTAYDVNSLSDEMVKNKQAESKPQAAKQILGIIAKDMYNTAAQGVSDAASGAKSAYDYATTHTPKQTANAAYNYVKSSITGK